MKRKWKIIIDWNGQNLELEKLALPFYRFGTTFSINSKYVKEGNKKGHFFVSFSFCMVM